MHLIERGTDVYVVSDAVSSRQLGNAEMALERLRGAGAEVVTTEMVVFEWLGRAGTPEFKELSALIK
jgi:nicotinamidase-related amidase